MYYRVFDSMRTFKFVADSVSFCRNIFTKISFTLSSIILKNGHTYVKNNAVFGHFSTYMNGLNIFDLIVLIGLLKVKLNAMLFGQKIFFRFKNID